MGGIILKDAKVLLILLNEINSLTSDYYINSSKLTLSELNRILLEFDSINPVELISYINDFNILKAAHKSSKKVSPITLTSLKNSINSALKGYKHYNNHSEYYNYYNDYDNFIIRYIYFYFKNRYTVSDEYLNNICKDVFIPYYNYKDKTIKLLLDKPDISKGEIILTKVVLDGINSIDTRVLYNKDVYLFLKNNKIFETICNNISDITFDNFVKLGNIILCNLD